MMKKPNIWEQPSIMVMDNGPSSRIAGEILRDSLADPLRSHQAQIAPTSMGMSGSASDWFDLVASKHPAHGRDSE